MNSSGIKRGLAVSAVAALGVVGIPGLAHAESIADQQATATTVGLVTPAADYASIKNDGVNTTAHLVAQGGSDVNQVRFEYSTDSTDGTTDGTWHSIATVARSSSGIFETEWAPQAALYNTELYVRATGLNNVGTDIAGSASASQVTVSPSAESVDIANGSGSALGVFAQPYTTAGETDSLAAVSGTTSDLAVAPTISVKGSGAAVTATAAPVADGATTRTWTAAVNMDGYTWDTTDPKIDQAIITATDGSDDAEAVAPYQQTIKDLTLTPKASTVQGGGTTSVDAKVVDQNGAPVVGARVVQDNGTGSGRTAYTGTDGVATFTGLGASDTAYKFHVDTTNDAAYNDGVDFQRSVTINSYTANATSITPSSKDAAFDFDEAASEGFKVTVKDQNGAALAGQTVTYAWTVTPFEATAGYPKTLDAQTVTTGADGTGAVAFPTNQPAGTYKLTTYINQDGTPGQGSGDLAGSDLTVKAGDGAVAWNDGSVAQTKAGTTGTYSGTIALEDGTPLPGRSANVVLADGTGGNAVLAATQPDGTTRTSDTAATVKADDKGAFSVSVADPAVAAGATQPTEADTLTASTTNEGSAALTVDFINDAAVDQTSTQASLAQTELAGEATPGRPVAVTIKVQNAAGTALTDLPVTVSTDHGFFTTKAATNLSRLNPAPAAAEGGEYGDWENLGTSDTTTTDDNGKVREVVAIGRDAGFDDDGQVTADVTFNVGGKTFTEPVVFSSTDPLNGGTVTVQLAPNQDSTVLPKARTDQDVNYVVHATDQFGNLVRVPVSVTDNSTSADLVNATGGTDTSSFTGSPVIFKASSSTAGSQTVSAKWTAAPTTTWTDADTTTDGFQSERTNGADSTKTGTKDLSGSAAPITWYAADYDASTYTLTHQGAGAAKVGSTVIETYSATDQEGQPLDVDVQFFRTGPDNFQTGSANGFVSTDASGKATYVFSGTKAGTAKVTAVASVPGGNVIAASQATDSVTFATSTKTAPAPGIKKVTAHSAGNKDVIFVTFSNAGGKRANLVVNGKTIAHGAVKNGRITFRVKDANGAKKSTRYVVKVAKASKAARTK